MSVRPKKSLGQHFLSDKNIAKDITDSLSANGIEKVLEIGPGMGVLTTFLLERQNLETWVVDIDKESIVYLKKNFPSLNNRIIEGDFLRLDIVKLLGNKFALIGNLPYNISSQIFFRVLDVKDNIPEMVFMVQREVGKRIASPPGSREYGILSVLLQAFYNIEYLFTVPEHVFIPPPKVKSGVIRLTRNERQELPTDELLFKKVVKQSFSTRRKTLRNALKPLNLPAEMVQDSFFNQRAEQLSVEDFIQLTQQIGAVPR